MKNIKLGTTRVISSVCARKKAVPAEAHVHFTKNRKRVTWQICCTIYELAASAGTHNSAQIMDHFDNFDALSRYALFPKREESS